MGCKKGERWRQRGKRGTVECAREEREREIGRRIQRKKGKEKEREIGKETERERETEKNREIREWKRKMQNVK